jgi:hypothetical protein
MLHMCAKGMFGLIGAERNRTFRQILNFTANVSCSECSSVTEYETATALERFASSFNVLQVGAIVSLLPFPPRRPGFKSHVGFVVDKVELGQVFSEYFGFPCQSSFHQFLHNHHHLSSGAGTIGQ